MEDLGYSNTIEQVEVCCSYVHIILTLLQFLRTIFTYHTICSNDLSDQILRAVESDFFVFHQ